MIKKIINEKKSQIFFFEKYFWQIGYSNEKAKGMSQQTNDNVLCMTSSYDFFQLDLSIYIMPPLD